MSPNCIRLDAPVLFSEATGTVVVYPDYKAAIEAFDADLDAWDYAGHWGIFLREFPFETYKWRIKFHGGE